VNFVVGTRSGTTGRLQMSFKYRVLDRDLGWGNGGRHGGPAKREEFTQWQWVTIQGRATPYPF
jgi:hypothetical protein